jgi:hypothetical protein
MRRSRHVLKGPKTTPFFKQFSENEGYGTRLYRFREAARIYAASFRSAANSTLMRRTRSLGCVHTGSGQAATAPPSKVVNSRRWIWMPCELAQWKDDSML